MLEVGHPWGTVLTGGEQSHEGAHRPSAPRGRATRPAPKGCSPYSPAPGRLLPKYEQAGAAARHPGEMLAKGEQVGEAAYRPWATCQGRAALPRGGRSPGASTPCSPMVSSPGSVYLLKLSSSLGNR